MSSVFGQYFKAATFGESHGKAVGVVVDGMPPGRAIKAEDIQRQLDRRRPGTSEFVSARREEDLVEILSGVANGKSLGTPIAMLVHNKDVRSGDYSALANSFRPGHADFTYHAKYGISPQPGGGRASARETVARVAAGALARVLLAEEGVSMQAYTVQIGSVKAQQVDLAFAESDPLRCADPDAAQAMAEEVLGARADRDSIGGMVELVVDGVPAGLGDPVFGKLDAALGGAMLSIGAVKGVEIGDGFVVASRRGSENNDPITPDGFASNHSGGILGGISTGQQLRVRLAIKPTPSIAQEQKTIDLQGNQTTITIKGRHDPCICGRVAPVAEAMAALVLADALLAQRAIRLRN